MHKRGKLRALVGAGGGRLDCGGLISSPERYLRFRNSVGAFGGSRGRILLKNSVQFGMIPNETTLIVSFIFFIFSRLF